MRLSQYTHLTNRLRAILGFIAAPCGIGACVYVARLPVFAIVSKVILSIRGFPFLVIGITLMLIVLVVEWRAILRYGRIDTVSLRDIEYSHPRLPSRVEMTMATVFSVALALLFFQFVTIVYAMTFTLHWTSQESKSSFQIVLADIDNDGDMDQVVFNSDGIDSDNIDVYTNASGNFSYVGTVGHSYTFSNAQPGDMDGDGDIDFIYAYTVGLEILRRTGGTFASYAISGVDAVWPTFVVVDADNDGDLDIVGAPFDYGGNYVHAFRRNDGHGNFTNVPLPLPSSIVSISSADFDGDGNMDLVLGSPSSPLGTDLSIYKGSGTGSFYLLNTESGISGGLSNVRRIETLDVDNDGDIDLIVTVEQISTTHGHVYIYKNNGAAVFSLFSEFQLDAVKSYAGAFGDLDNDGDFDFISGGTDTAGLSAGTQVWVNDGSGNFSESGTSPHPTTCTRQVAIGDIDADGDLDYVAANLDCNVNGGPELNRQYNNDQSVTNANAAPSAPSSLTGALQPPDPKNGSTFANDNVIGTVAWTSPSNVQLEDGSTSNAGSMVPGVITQYLTATNFGFTVPANATIHGIKVEVKKGATGTIDVLDNTVRIIKATIQSTDKSDPATWQNPALSYTTYGGPTDLWGTTWTPSDINASNFGFAISAYGLSGVDGGASIDHIRVTVYYSVRDIRFSWGSGSDVETPTRMLQYQLRVGTGSNANNIVSGVVSSPNWVSRILPNDESRTRLVKNIPCGNTIYWSVATVDSGFATAASPEQSFVLDSSCAQLPSGSSPSSPSSGGGLPASFFRSNGSSDGDSSPSSASLTVTAFNDLDGDGNKSSGEPGAFRGLTFTASGRTAEDLAVHNTLAVNERGQIIFSLPASDDRGYWISVDSGSSLLDGYEPTGLTSSGGYVLRSGGKAEATFGFRRTDLLTYRPCLTVGNAQESEVPGRDANILLQRLQDAFGAYVTRGIDLKDELVTRKEFFTLLFRTQCVSPLLASANFEDAIRAAAKDMKITLPLIDVPIDVSKPDSLLIYSLIVAKADVVRETTIGFAADLTSPITRDEAMRAVHTVLSIPASRATKEGDLPKDIDPADPIAVRFLALHELKILPDSFSTILGPSQGLNPDEAALFIARTAFSAGKIHLLPEVSFTKKKSGTTPTFLALLPAMRQRTCFEKDPNRSSNVNFVDVLPGDRYFADLQDLVSRGTPNSAKQMLWLLTGTRRPTEFGIGRGRIAVSLQEPVSILETVRNLLVLACLPPPTIADVLSGKQSPLAPGSGETKVARDRITGLPRDASFASRVMYRAQDHIREFDLSLFTYIPEILRGTERSPGSGLDVREASRILASGLLMMSVREKVVTPQQAENLMEELSDAIRTDILGKDVDWRSESSLSAVPFTRQMLIQFLATVVSGRTAVSDSSSSSSLPLGELWWERIK